MGCNLDDDTGYSEKTAEVVENPAVLVGKDQESLTNRALEKYRLHLRSL